MGICEPELANETKAVKGYKEKKKISINKLYNINLMNFRQNECIKDPLKPFIEFAPDISKLLSKEICRIVMGTQNGKKIGTGFFLYFPIDLEFFYCLITNDHIIDNESINNNQIIYLTYDEYKVANIK